MPPSVVAMPPAAGPDRGVDERTMLWENSEVLPLGSVAVAVTSWPGGRTPRTSVEKVPLQLPSVTTTIEPRYVAPSRGACGRPAHTGAAKRSTSYEVDAAAVRAPSMCVVVLPGTTDVMIGKFWSPLAPESPSQASSGVTPGWNVASSRSMPSG